MLDIFYKAQGITPCRISAHHDKVQVWLKSPLANERLDWLDHRCGPRGLHVLNRRMKFHPEYRQRLQLNQPTTEAIAYLARQNELLLNRVEWSLDWIFDDADEKDEAWDLVCSFHVKKHHRKQGIRFVAGDTRYSGPKNAPNVLAVYRDRPSKLDRKERPCLHFDWRIKGSSALRRAGFSSVADLLRVDHRTFWLTRLIMYELTPDQLGRRYHQSYTPASRNRRTPWIWTSERWRLPYNRDRSVAGIISSHVAPLRRS